MGRFLNLAKSALFKFGLEMQPIKKVDKRQEISGLYNRIEIPSDFSKKSDVISREYRIFKKEEQMSRKLNSIYEKLCHASEGVLKIDPDEETRKKIEHAVKITHVNITPRGAMALTVLACISVITLSIFLMLTKALIGIGLTTNYGILLMLFAIPLGFYLYTHPTRLEKRYMIRAGSEMSFLILYMVVYMRESPNMEGALEFASRNLSGPLARDMRKLLWDVEMGKYRNVDEALVSYGMMWLSERYFVESIQLIRSSMKQNEDRRMALLDEAIETILSGTRDKAKTYSESLKMPIMLIHSMGILLPVMGLVMFPIIGIFLDVKSDILFIGYDIILPMALFFFISEIMESRPVTFNRLTVSRHPDMPPDGKFLLKTKNGTYFVPALPFAFAIFFIISTIGLILYLGAGKDNLNASVIISIGMMAGIFAYYFLSSFQKLKLREETRSLEKEFTEALFQLGNHVSSGVPIELAVDKSAKSVNGLVIKQFFQIILRNIKDLGMTFSEAIFDKEYGAINFYPSKLVRSIMRIVVDSSRKGVQIAAITMLNISKYLKNLYENQEKIHDMLEDVMSSLRFQGFLLTPLVSGIIVTMATTIIQIMGNLTTSMAGIKSTSYSSLSMLPWNAIQITPGEFQLVCSIYFIETSILVGMFINGIENGEDKIGEQDSIASILLIGSIIYLICLYVSMAVFSPLTKIMF